MPRRPPPGRLTDLYVAASLAIIPLSLLGRVVLPGRYYSDGNTIRLIATGEFWPVNDQSFRRVGLLYRALGMADKPLVASLLGAALAIVVLYPALVRARGIATLPAYLLVGLYVVTASAYLTQYSKDIWVIPVVLAVLLARPGPWGELLIVTATGLYAFIFRDYWWLVLATYVALRVVTAPALRWGRVVFTVAAVIAGVTVLAPWVLKADIQSIRNSINVTRILSADATTAIATPDLGLGVFGDVLENLALCVQLIVPIPLLAQGSLLYVFYAVAIFALWASFAWSTGHGPLRVFDGRPALRSDVHVVRAALFVVAVVVTFSFFEPDYGSYLRHLTPMLPLIIVATFARVGSPFLIPPDQVGPGEPPAGRDARAPEERESDAAAGPARRRRARTTGGTRWA